MVYGMVYAMRKLVLIQIPNGLRIFPYGLRKQNLSIIKRQSSLRKVNMRKLCGILKIKMKYVALAFVLSLVILQISAQGGGGGGGGFLGLLLQKEFMPDSWFDYKLANMAVRSLGGGGRRNRNTQTGGNRGKSGNNDWLWLAALMN
ncbi:hypothetical protein FSP39_018816 [Pinctada imbricata]|uniref:Uncharacterized protein n=1 Tax=Pinctada imbricata TaxID=66713 RepID=A0AA88YKK6_PINIB|nr:hypothetical protein FSP39_018816 [Pinctada imbricata]